MKTKIKGLLQKSQSIGEAEKQTYIKLIEFLNEDQIVQLLIIFENEQEQISNLENEKAKAKNDINTKYLERLNAFFKTEEKKSIASEEKKEKVESEKLLDKIENL